MLNTAKMEGNDRYKFLSEAANTATKLDGILVNQEDGIIKIMFVKSTENDSDIMTKNVSKPTFDAHINKFMMTEAI